MNQEKKDALSFEDIVRGKSRNVAAGIFYQLLILKTHKYINLEQNEAYKDIKISKDVFDRNLPSVVSSQA